MGAVLQAGHQRRGAGGRGPVDACADRPGLQHGGTYYLPYQRHATQAQFAAAYPQADRFRATKAVWDPTGRMCNMLWAQYL